MKLNSKHVAIFAGVVLGDIVGNIISGGIITVKNKIKESKQKKEAQNYGLLFFLFFAKITKYIMREYGSMRCRA